MSNKAIVLDANILIRAVLGKRVRDLLFQYAPTVKFFALLWRRRGDLDNRPGGVVFGGVIQVCLIPDLVAEFGALAPASYCQMPQTLRVAFWDHVTSLSLL